MRLNSNSKRNSRRSISMLYANLAGAKQELLEKLPQPDILTYILIGVSNIFIIICLTAVGFILLHNSGFALITAVALGLVGFILFASVQIKLTGSIINTKNKINHILFIFWSILIVCFAGLLLNKHLDAQKYEKYVVRYHTLKKDSISIAIREKEQYYLKIRSDIIQSINEADKKITSAARPLGKMNDTQSLRESLNRVERDNDADISLLRYKLKEEETFLNGYKGESNIKLELFFTLLFALVINILIYIYVRQARGDLYHTLLAENMKLTKETIEKQREKIVEEFKTRTELKQTKTVLEDIAQNNPFDNDLLRKALDKLNDEYTPESLYSAAVLLKQLGRYEKALEYINKAIELNFEDPELWRYKAELWHELKDYNEEKAAKDRYTELYSKTSFQRNLKQKMTLCEAEINNINFYGSFVWRFTGNINVLLGKNGYGKSHLMSIILAQLQEETSTLIELSKINSTSNPQTSPATSFIRIKVDNGDPYKTEEIEKLESKIGELNKRKSETYFLEKKPSDEANSDISDDARKLIESCNSEILLIYDSIDHLKGRSYFDRSGSIKSTFGKIPVLAIPDSRFINKSSNSTTPVSDEKANKILDYGAHHFIMQASYEQIIQNFLNMVCDVFYLERSFNDEIFNLINRVFLKLTDNKFEWIDIRRTQDNSGNIILVKTEGNSEPLPIQKVSQGSLSVLAMFGIIFHYLSLRFPDIARDQLTKQHSIVFIDEIDAHLHPSWQQKIVSLLRYEFSNLQFVFSAHSPLVAAGCKENEVSVLRKTNNGFKIETIETHLIGMPIADIFRLIFEIEDKDETSLHLDAMLPFQNMIMEDFNKLKNKTSLNENENRKLAELGQQIENFRYYESYETLKNEKETMEDMKNKYDTLKTEFDKLQSELNLFQRNINP